MAIMLNATFRTDAALVRPSDDGAPCPGDSNPCISDSHAGPRDGVPVVLLHGSMSSKSQWKSLSRALSARHRVIAIDLYGYGARALPPLANGADFGLWSEAELVQQEIDALLGPGQPYHLVGHSYGGAVALRLALGGRVRSLTLYEPSAFHLLQRSDPALRAVRAVADALRLAVSADEQRSGTERYIDFWNGAGAYAAMNGELQTCLQGMNRKLQLDFQALLRDPLTLPDYHQLAMPVCLLAGRHSPDCSHAVVKALAAARLDLQLQFIDAGHMGPLTRPDLVDPLIAGFIASVEAEHQASLAEAAPAAQILPFTGATSRFCSPAAAH